MEKKTYQIKVVEVNSYGTNSSCLDLKLESLEDCKKVIEIAHVANWEINLTDGGLFGELVERSAEYQAFLNKESDKQAAQIKNQNEKVERINALPKSYDSKIQLPDGCRIVYERSDASFKPHVSSAIQWCLSTKVLCDDRKLGGGVDTNKPLYIHDYVTKDKKVQVTKFAHDMRFLFGDAAIEISPTTIRDIIHEFNRIHAQIINS